MSAIHSKDTTLERIVRSVLHRLGCRFALHLADLPGKPDIVMPARRTIAGGGRVALPHVEGEG
jgi:G:T-mismatch repair DNA endonuclease (very short patch repair protein)